MGRRYQQLGVERATVLVKLVTRPANILLLHRTALRIGGIRIALTYFSVTYDHRLRRIGHPVRPAIHNVFI
jgi:hypothetical protein